ncbi:hypothetical protein GCM10010123_19580 [Pilimelia anulata]|uniref:DUF2637 domain-containing protein n=1 Tax=Pilimelia anulata TaxID=53371 RepID=A0A8J3F8K9_9ACTN|nr:DUF2637 domain-containing protein [Pilimelia anulata]GGJ89859.1 hypothetical protein GCM10010123_19580 [Pilimelia anulata]
MTALTAGRSSLGSTPMTLKQLIRIRWAVRGVLMLGVAASVGANILHAQDHLIARAVAAWPPIALLLTIEVIGRVPVHRRVHAIIRIVATTGIAAIAAWVSYWHMVAVAARYGETGSDPYLLPLSVDGLVVVASISLVEIAGRIRILKAGALTTAAGAATPGKFPTTPSGEPSPAAPDDPNAAPAGHDPDGAGSGAPPDMPLPADSAPPSGDEPIPNDEKADPSPDEVPAGIKEAVLYWHARDLDPDQIAERVDRSVRTVYRYLPKPAEDTDSSQHSATSAA